VADAVRRAITEAEGRAQQIASQAEADAAQVRERAEAEAAQIRERAVAEAAQIRERGEADARQQIDAARKALDELGGSLAAAVSPPEPAPDPEPDPEPEPVEEPTGVPEAPVSPPAPTEEQPAAATGNGDDAAERLVAMKLAVDGKDRAAIDAELESKFGSRDRSSLLDDVLSRAGR
jgi:cell division septum initiation protein DivIVA